VSRPAGRFPGRDNPPSIGATSSRRSICVGGVAPIPRRADGHPPGLVPQSKLRNMSSPSRVWTRPTFVRSRYRNRAWRRSIRASWCFISSVAGVARRVAASAGPADLRSQAADGRSASRRLEKLRSELGDRRVTDRDRKGGLGSLAASRVEPLVERACGPVCWRSPDVFEDHRVASARKHP
jgi:hypothetical protein